MTGVDLAVEDMSTVIGTEGGGVEGADRTADIGESKPKANTLCNDSGVKGSSDLNRPLCSS